MSAVSCVLKAQSCQCFRVFFHGLQSFGDMWAVQPWDSVPVPLRGFLPSRVNAPHSAADWLHLWSNRHFLPTEVPSCLPPRRAQSLLGSTSWESRTLQGDLFSQHNSFIRRCLGDLVSILFSGHFHNSKKQLSLFNCIP